MEIESERVREKLEINMRHTCDRERKKIGKDDMDVCGCRDHDVACLEEVCFKF